MKFTEKQMADEFELFLASESVVEVFGKFDRTFREVLCYQGRPDFIAIKRPFSSDFSQSISDSKIISSLLLSILKPKAFHTLKYLEKHTGYSQGKIKSVLDRLVKNDIVETHGHLYRLSSDIQAHNTEIWVFELKLKNPKRAIFQAKQSRAYANTVYIVVPPGQEKHYDKYRILMKDWGLGLVTFSIQEHEIRIVAKARVERPISKYYRFDTLQKLF